jgi:hypothetical protein
MSCMPPFSASGVCPAADPGGGGSSLSARVVATQGFAICRTLSAVRTTRAGDTVRFGGNVTAPQSLDESWARSACACRVSAPLRAALDQEASMARRTAAADLSALVETHARFPGRLAWVQRRADAARSLVLVRPSRITAALEARRGEASPGARVELRIFRVAAEHLQRKIDADTVLASLSGTLKQSARCAVEVAYESCAAIRGHVALRSSQSAVHTAST